MNEASTKAATAAPPALNLNPRAIAKLRGAHEKALARLAAHDEKRFPLQTAAQTSWGNLRAALGGTDANSSGDGENGNGG
jgi:hypothetical protein